MSYCTEEVQDAKEAGNNILTGQLTVFISDDCITSYPELSDLNNMHLWGPVLRDLTSQGFMGKDSGTA